MTHAFDVTCTARKLQVRRLAIEVANGTIAFSRQGSSFFMSALGMRYHVDHDSDLPALIDDVNALLTPKKGN